ncbi:hypothetical protein, partial [Billgrantia antri]|uniref:hypothetical protein n=1 Tax=Billgrantia antri TaxID=2846777 RepID=UPI003B21FB6D
EDHADRPLMDLRGISFGSAHGSILSRFGASGNPGTVQTPYCFTDGFIHVFDPNSDPNKMPV